MLLLFSGMVGHAVAEAWANDSGAFIEEDGIVVVEAESGEYDGDWVYYDNADLHDKLSSFTGDGFLRFEGNATSSGPPADPITYKIKITMPGTYKIYMRGMAMSPGSSDQSNDCYIKMKGQSGALGKDKKLYIAGQKQRSFQWMEKLDVGGHNVVYPEYKLTTGIHEFVVSGRSKYFVFDRFVLHEASGVSKSTARDLTLSESAQVEGDGETAVELVRAAQRGSTILQNQVSKRAVRIYTPLGRSEGGVRAFETGRGGLGYGGTAGVYLLQGELTKTRLVMPGGNHDAE